jgi:cytochrome c biogenesis protein CcmG/thiol:disulfide interchange protein DsbE
MTERKRLVLLTGLILSFIVSCSPGGDSSGQKGFGEGPRVGYRAPNFRLTNLEGKEVSLAGEKGKVVFLNFWATWCVPCKAEMPSMEKLYHDYKDKGLEILAVSNDIQGEKVVKPFIEKMGVSYPVLMDPDFHVNEKYLIRTVPTSIIVGRDGVITNILVGARDWDAKEARDLMSKLLGART